MFKLKYKYNPPRILLLTDDGEVVCYTALKMRNVFSLLQRAFQYYQEHRIKEVGEEAFLREVFEFLTEKMTGEVGKENKKACKEFFKKLGLKFDESEGAGAPSASNHGYTTLTPPPDYDGILPTYSTIEESSSEPAESRRAPEEKQTIEPNREQETGQKASQENKQKKTQESESEKKNTSNSILDIDMFEYFEKQGLLKYALNAPKKDKKKDEQDFD